MLLDDLAGENCVTIGSAADVILSAVAVLVQLFGCHEVFGSHLMILLQTACVPAELSVSRRIDRMKKVQGYGFVLGRKR
jgi:hypothetical protein